MLSRMLAHWVQGAALAALLLLLLMPLFAAGWPLPLKLAYLHLPAYLLHQFEEHDGDRFRLHFNRTIGRGFEVLSPGAVFVTNVVVVWLLLVGALYAACWLHPGWSLIAVYLVLVNAFVHLVHALLFRSYNPGLATALLLFLPLGLVSLRTLDAMQEASRFQHSASLALGLLIHVAILVQVRRRLRVLQRSAASASA